MHEAADDVTQSCLSFPSIHQSYSHDFILFALFFTLLICKVSGAVAFRAVGLDRCCDQGTDRTRRQTHRHALDPPDESHSSASTLESCTKRLCDLLLVTLSSPSFGLSDKHPRPHCELSPTPRSHLTMASDAQAVMLAHKWTDKVDPTSQS